MKASKFFAAGLCALSFAGMANGQTVVHVVGSTAFRAPFIKSVIDLFNGPKGALAPSSDPTYQSDSAASWGNTNPYKCNGIAISGTYNGAWYVIDAYFTGSASGVANLVAQNHLGAFLNWNTVGHSASLASAVATGSSGSIIDSTSPYTTATNYFDNSTPTPDVAFSDSYEGSDAKLFGDANFASNVGSYATGPALQSAITSAGLVDSGTGAASTAKTVGIIPFEWLINNPGSGNPAQATNITQEIIKELVTNGYAPLSQFTGNSSDAGTNVFLIGRNEDSGTRIDSLAEAQAGFDVKPVQAQVFFNTAKATGAYPINTTDPWYHVGGNGAEVQGVLQFPANSDLNTETNISWPNAGHSGYITGGDVGNVLLATSTNFTAITSGSGIDSNYGVSGTGAAFVGYIGLADASSAVAANNGTGSQTNSNGDAKVLGYDGVTYSTAGVQDGTYTVWDYEHMYHLSSIGATAKTLVDAVAVQIFTVDASADTNGVNGAADAAGILYGTVSTTAIRAKTGEGGIVTP